MHSSADVSGPVVFGIVHSAPSYDCLQVCHFACSAAESPMLACMTALSLAALLLLVSLQHKRTVIIDSLRVSKHYHYSILTNAQLCVVVAFVVECFDCWCRPLEAVGLQHQCSWWAKCSPEHVVLVRQSCQTRQLTAMCWKYLFGANLHGSCPCHAAYRCAAGHLHSCNV